MTEARCFPLALKIEKRARNQRMQEMKLWKIRESLQGDSLLDPLEELSRDFELLITKTINLCVYVFFKPASLCLFLIEVIET